MSIVKFQQLFHLLLIIEIIIMIVKFCRCMDFILQYITKVTKNVNHRIYYNVITCRITQWITYLRPCILSYYIITIVFVAFIIN